MQLKLSAREISRLNQRADEDFLAAIGDHTRRMERFRRYYRLWRNLADPPAAGEEEASNFSVPMVQWQTFQKWARELESLLGEDAEIIAKPVGPSDQRRVHKVGRYATWRLFQSMRITKPLAVFDFRKILFGRAHAYRPWIRRTFDTPEGPQVDYEGPGFFPLWPDDLIVPAEDVDCIQDFSFVIRRYRATPDQLLRGDGTLYQGIRERFAELVEHSKNRLERDPSTDEVKREKDDAEGVDYDSNAYSGGGAVIVHEWYGRWRPLKGRADGREDNLDRRHLIESGLVVRRIPDLDWVIGVQDLMDLYPKMRRRRPFVEATLVNDGSYWGLGLGEMLEELQKESSVTHNLMTEAGELSVGPVIVVRPSTGLTEDNIRYGPKQIIWSEDPGGVQVVHTKADLQYPIVKDQQLTAMGERVTGISDLTVGRASDRPNAPRTASGTIALLESGNIRIALDTRMLREDMGIIAEELWELDTQFAPEEIFFRVTEEDAKGLFDTGEGGSVMTSQERGGRYDFDIKFATSVWSREANKDRALQLYQIDMGNPLVATNPRALWLALQRAHKALGDDNIADLVPEPPELDAPKRPTEEWTLALEGEDILVHPADNDDLHLLDHYRILGKAAQDPDADPDAVLRMRIHVAEHHQQKRAKMLMQAATEQLAQSLQSGQGGLTAGGAPASLDQVSQLIDSLRNPDAQPPGGAPQP